MFLNYTNGDIDAAAKRIRVFYKAKKEMPNFFKNRDPESADIMQCLNTMHFATFPISPNKCNLIYGRLSDYDPKNYFFDPVCKTFIMLSEAYLYRNGPNADTIFVFDLKGSTFSHLMRTTIASIRNGMFFLESATPLNIKEIHIFNTVPFMSYIFGKLIN